MIAESPPFIPKLPIFKWICLLNLSLFNQILMLYLRTSRVAKDVRSFKCEALKTLTVEKCHPVLNYTTIEIFFLPKEVS